MTHDSCDRIKTVEKLLFGNGVTGIAKKVENHETYILKQIGSFKTIKWFLGFVGIGEIVLILKAFIK